MALPKDQRFKNLTVDFRKMTKLSMRDRMSMLGSRQGAELLSSLDPSQLQSLFPDYYMKDAGLAKTLSSITGRKVKPSETVKEETAGRAAPPTERDLRRRNRAERAREEEQPPEWARKLGVTAKKSERAELTSEQRDTLGKMRRGESVTGDEAEFISRLTPEQRQKFNIVENTNPEGKRVFSLGPSKTSQLSDDQIAEELKRSTSAGVARGSVGEVIQRGEVPGRLQGTPNAYNVYNQGEAHRYRTGVTDFSRMSIEEVMRRQNLPKSDPNKLFAVGAYQIIPPTMREAVRSLGLDPKTTNLDAATQQKLFAWLSEHKRPGMGAFITGKSDNLTKAQNEMALEWAGMSLATDMVVEGKQRRAGQSAYGGPNKAHVSAETTAAALKQAREAYQKNIKAGMSHEEAYRQAITGVMPGQGSGQVTPEAITRERERREQLEQRQTEQGIAELQPKPQLPPGLDPRVVEAYNSQLNTRQAQQAAAAFNKLYQERGEEGIRQYNQQFDKNPGLGLSRLSTSGEIGVHRFADEGVQRRMEGLSEEARDSANRFLRYSSTGVISSTYRDPERNRRAGGVAGSAHTVGNAIDVRTNGRTREQMLEDVKALKQAGFNKVLIEKDHLHAERIPGSNDFSISVRRGHKPPEGLTLEEAQAVAAQTAFNVPLDRAIEQQNQTAQQAAPQQQAEQARKTVLLAAGTNDWSDEQKAYEGIMSSARALQAQGKDVKLVLPAELVNGKPHAFNAAQRVARELGIEPIKPSSFGRGNDHYHISSEAAQEIRSRYPNAEVRGDSNAVRLGAREGVTGFTGESASAISRRIQQEAPPQQQPQQAAPAPQQQQQAQQVAPAPQQSQQSAQQQPQQAAPAPQPEQPEQPETIALSYGGEVQTDASQLTAIPMDQPRTDVNAPIDRRDNMAVVDEKGQTQFTMNDSETVSLKNGKAEVQTEEMIKSDEVKPIQDNLKREERQNEREQAERLEMIRNQPQMNDLFNDTNMQNVNDAAVSATDELFNSPSFSRAMKERYFLKDESPMGGNHFSPV